MSAVHAAIGSSELPLGAIIPFYGPAPNSEWLECDGTDTTGTSKELQTNYPGLYSYLGNSNILPDLRECVLVGSGKNTTDSITAHDVYNVGKFKDDQFQGHNHEQYQATSEDEANWNRSYLISGWAWRNTRNITEMTGMTAPRYGTTTHGKQKGVTYCIKAV